MRLSDTIEAFIKVMLSQEEQEVELKRNELAEYFRCAPSQINYVLSTRFTPDHGYVIESRRGGGCIRIVRLQHEEGEYLNYLVNERIGDSIDQKAAQILLGRLAEDGNVTRDEAKLMYSAITSEALSVPIPEKLKNAVRAKILRNMLLMVARRAQG